MDAKIQLISGHKNLRGTLSNEENVGSKLFEVDGSMHYFEEDKILSSKLFGIKTSGMRYSIQTVPFCSNGPAGPNRIYKVLLLDN